MTHSDLVNAILLVVSPLGLAWNNNTGALKDKTARLVRYGLPGSADVLACVRGRFIGIEAKVGGDRQSQTQKDFADALRKAGGIYILARSVDDVTSTLRLEGMA